MKMELSEYFDEFMELYENEKIRFIWKQNSFITIADKEVDEGEDFRDFIFNLVNSVRHKVLKGKIDEELKEYEEYVDKLLRYDPEIKDDIITRCTSKVNICNRIDYEVLTKRNEKLEPQCYSALLNLNLEKPNFGQDIPKQVNFELSIKDLKLFSKIIDQALEEIETLNKNKLD